MIIKAKIRNNLQETIPAQLTTALAKLCSSSILHLLA
jgi:hypothetical protein